MIKWWVETYVNYAKGTKLTIADEVSTIDNS